MEDQKEHPDERILLIFGLGYSGTAVARAAVANGWQVIGTSRDPARASAPPGVAIVAFDAAGLVITTATHILITAAPGEMGDPVLAKYTEAISKAPALRWIGYLSTTGIYGDRGGDWVDETTAPAPGQPRTQRRLDVEQAWVALAAEKALDIFRVGGIYGPGRSALDSLRDGSARRTVKPGHCFSMIHRDDIALAVLAAILQTNSQPQKPRVLNLVDDEPIESAWVVEEAARLLGVVPPPAQSIEEAFLTMSALSRSFWAENRRVSSIATKAALGIAWRYPSYREGLAAIHRDDLQ
jgi:nucleoside-diphosphate-sugar epimerase